MSAIYQDEWAQVGLCREAVRIEQESMRYRKSAEAVDRAQNWQDVARVLGNYLHAQAEVLRDQAIQAQRDAVAAVNTEYDSWSRP